MKDIPQLPQVGIQPVAQSQAFSVLPPKNFENKAISELASALAGVSKTLAKQEDAKEAQLKAEVDAAEKKRIADQKLYGENLASRIGRDFDLAYAEQGAKLRSREDFDSFLRQYFEDPQITQALSDPDARAAFDKKYSSLTDKYYGRFATDLSSNVEKERETSLREAGVAAVLEATQSGADPMAAYTQVQKMAEANYGMSAKDFDELVGSQIGEILYNSGQKQAAVDFISGARSNGIPFALDANPKVRKAATGIIYRVQRDTARAQAKAERDRARFDREFRRDPPSVLLARNPNLSPQDLVDAQIAYGIAPQDIRVLRNPDAVAFANAFNQAQSPEEVVSIVQTLKERTGDSFSLAVNNLRQYSVLDEKSLRLVELTNPRYSMLRNALFAGIKGGGEENFNKILTARGIKLTGVDGIEAKLNGKLTNYYQTALKSGESGQSLAARRDADLLALKSLVAAGQNPDEALAIVVQPYEDKYDYTEDGKTRFPKEAFDITDMKRGLDLVAPDVSTMIAENQIVKPAGVGTDAEWKLLLNSGSIEWVTTSDDSGVTAWHSSGFPLYKTDGQPVYYTFDQLRLISAGTMSLADTAVLNVTTETGSIGNRISEIIKSLGDLAPTVPIVNGVPTLPPLE